MPTRVKVVDLVEPGSAGVPCDMGVVSEERYGGLDGSVRVLVGYREHTPLRQNFEFVPRYFGITNCHDNSSAICS